MFAFKDNDNCEMMTHIEGPIVDSFYDMSLTTWHNALKPPLPSHSSPAAAGGVYGFVPETQGKTPDPNHPVQGQTVPAQEPFQSVYGDQNTGGEQKVEALADNKVHQDQPEKATPQSTTNDANGQGSVQGSRGAGTSGNRDLLPEHTSKDPHYDVDIAGEVLRMQDSLKPRNGETKMQALTRHLSTSSDQYSKLC